MKVAVVGAGSVGVDGEAGIRDVCLSMPSVVGRTGVQTVLPVPLSDEETAGLRHSAERDGQKRRAQARPLIGGRHE